MRIAMVSVHSSPLASLGGKEAGGMNVYVRELSRELGRRGVDVDIFTRSQDPAAPAVVQLDRRVRVVNLHTGPLAPYDKNWVLTYLPEFVSRMRCFADGEDLSYDLLHSHYWLSGAAALSLRRSWGVPMVHMFHTLGALKNKVARGEAEREALQRIEIERQLMDQADAIVAATALDRDQMVEFYGVDADGIRIAPCGVDLELFQPRDQAAARAALNLPAAPHRLVLLVGRMEPLKGIDALIRAVALLFEQQPQLRGQLTALVVGGNNEQERSQWNAEQHRLDALRRELGVTEAVRFMGARPQEQLPQFFAAADVVTMPSHYESFGMVALEGMASGRPVIATAAGGPSLFIEEGRNGLLVPPDRADVLASQLWQLFSNNELRERLGSAARWRAEGFGWPAVACEVMQVYRETLEQATLERSLSRLSVRERAHV